MFITFEGSEGSGKTTHIRNLAQFLRQQGYETVETRQPGGTEIGRQIRDILHHIDHEAMTAEAEILLYSADRAQHVGQVIRPALAAGKIVLCDRYADSTLAYQGYGRGLSLEHLRWITQFATGGLKPDLTFFLEVDIAEGLRRRSAGQLEMNRMDLQSRDFYERIQTGYEKLMALDPERWVRIDANRPVSRIQADLRTATLARLQRSPA